MYKFLLFLLTLCKATLHYAGNFDSPELL